MEAPKRRGNYIFTASPNVIAQARRGEKPFKPDPRYREIRALFPIPSLTVQWVVRQDSDIKSLADLAGHSFIPGPRGSISERLTARLCRPWGSSAGCNSSMSTFPPPRRRSRAIR